MDDVQPQTDVSPLSDCMTHIRRLVLSLVMVRFPFQMKVVLSMLRTRLLTSCGNARENLGINEPFYTQISVLLLANPSSKLLSRSIYNKKTFIEKSWFRTQKKNVLPWKPSNEGLKYVNEVIKRS